MILLNSLYKTTNYKFSIMNDIQSLNQNSRVWIYQSNREFTEAEVELINQQIASFTQSWTSHNQELKAAGNVYHQRFIVLMVDQSMAGASGCSIDKSVKFIQFLESEYNVDMFDRMNFAYEQDQSVMTAHREGFQDLYKKGIIDDDTFVFNNLVDTKQGFETNWKVKLGDSWHKNLIN